MSAITAARKLLTRVFGRKPATARNAPKPRLGCETLEAREVPAYLSGGVLVIDGTAGNDVVSVTNATVQTGWYQSAPGYRVTENGRMQLFTAQSVTGAAVWFRGNAGNDRFSASVGIQVVAEGGAGNDTLTGGYGWDYLYGQGGEDVLMGGEGVDYLYGGADFDQLHGGGNDDHLFGEGGWDQLHGNAGHDKLIGDSMTPTAADAGDELYGGWGNDTLRGGGGNDYLRGEGDNDVLYGEGGNDTVYGDNAGNPWGGEGIDHLYGGSEDDALYGEGNDDTLYGEAGNDGLFGGRGVNFLLGGVGADRFLTGLGTDVTWGYHQYTGAGYGYDRVTSEDAMVFFVNGGTVTFQGRTYAGKDWAETDVVRIDQALAVLHGDANGTRLLKTATLGDLYFARHDTTNRGFNNGWIHLTDAQVGSTDTYLLGYTLHEIGHNWHTPEAFGSANLANFVAQSGWTNTNPNNPAYTQGTDPITGSTGWWYLNTSTFASGYATTSPEEDFAESFAAYFTARAGWTYYNGAGASAIPVKMDIFSYWTRGL